MGRDSKIEWTKHTWNPIQGCTKISPACKNCYMYAEKKRFGQDGSVFHRSSDATFYKPLIWHRQLRGDEPITERLVFTASYSDWFLESADEHRPEMWKIVRETPNLIYQILTKRTDRILENLPDDWGTGYPNVWLGATVEIQDYDWRIRDLLNVPAVKRFLSCEPLLGPLNLNPYLNTKFIDSGCYAAHAMIDWVIVGGESGTGARPMELRWVRSIRNQCLDPGTAFFFKQWGAFGADGVRRSKSANGRLLDGRTWDEFPEAFNG
ncbi:MAG: phage Gp37/Gp68 family protein [Pyrinomonadaceae bacterium]|nr:phage Gp37/Gp68 family protein [Pyrinomonadaceae bacterium]